MYRYFLNESTALSEKMLNSYGVLHILIFWHFPHRLEMGNSSHSLRWLLHDRWLGGKYPLTLLCEKSCACRQVHINTIISLLECILEIFRFEREALNFLRVLSCRSSSLPPPERHIVCFLSAVCLLDVVVQGITQE